MWPRKEQVDEVRDRVANGEDEDQVIQDVVDKALGND